MNNKQLIVVFSVVAVASFVGSLLGAYLVEKTGSPVFPQAGPQMQSGAPQGGAPLQGGAPQGGTMQPQSGYQQGSQQVQQLCGDGVCDAFEKQNNVCPEDCKK